jgi:hypothetical protein
MAGRMLTSFLVGIGFDTSGIDAGVRNVDRGMGEVKGSALKISAALVGAFGAAAASVVKTAGEVDQLALKTANMRTSTQFVYNYGNALKSLGGDAADAVAVVGTIEEALNNLRLKGNLGSLQDLGLAGIDTSQLLGAANADEFLRLLSEQMPGLDMGQRGLVQQTMGLSDAALKSLVSGPAAFDDAMKRAESLTGSIEGLTENSRRLMEESARFGQIIEGITNKLAEEFLPSIIGVSGRINSFLMEHRDTIGAGIEYAADNSAAVSALGAGASASLLGAGASKLGMRAVGGAVSKAGTAGMAVAGGAMGADLLNSYLTDNVSWYGKAAAGFDSMLEDVLGVDRIMSPSELLFGGYEPANENIATSQVSREERERSQAQVLANAISRAPIVVQNSMNVQLDGQALEAKITEVTERQAAQAVEDISSTTAR